MALAPGSRLGPYEILSPVGAGGMGEVYAASDTRLDRTVAVKVLPESVGADPSRRARFEREARALSGIKHPHICTLYDVGTHDGVDYLVMEHLEGETLGTRLGRGALPPDEALRVAIQIADGLERAHRQGVIHRDLKPGNIMLTREGAKLLDFGLAKNVDPSTSGAGLFTAAGSASASPATPTALPTASRVPTPLTAEGTVMGTFQYMAPELLEGGEADARSDIFAFGLVLYEMIAGRRAFEGKTQASLAAAILKEQPRSLAETQPLTPPALERVVSICMAKNPDERWQTMHDILLQLRWISEGGSQAGVPAPVAARRHAKERHAWIVAAIAVVAAVALLAVLLTRASPETRVLRASLLAPPGTEYFIKGTIQPGPAALSPDGRRVAFSAKDGSGQVMLWVRSLDAAEAVVLKGTEGASYAFWAPDGRTIGFFAQGHLKKIDVLGGPAIVLCEAPTGKGGTWSPDGVILFAPAFNTRIFKLSAGGGTAEPVTKFDEAAGDNSHRFPQFLPDGRHFIYLARSQRGAAGGGNAIRVGDLETGDSSLLMPTVLHAEYASGHLLYVQDGILMARPFDPSALRLTGDPVPVADNVGDLGGAMRGNFSASDNGTLVYGIGGGERGLQLQWFDRSGAQGENFGDPAEYVNMIRFSPDGKSLAAVITDSGAGTTDIWLYEIARGVRSRFTLEPGSEVYPVWSPDGRNIAYSSDQGGGHFGIHVKEVGSAAPGRLLLAQDTDLWPTSWSADGRLLVFERRRPANQAGEVSTDSDIWVAPIDGSSDPRPLVESPFVEVDAALSPDERWLAFDSNESGKFEIYAMPFPGPGERLQISTQGGIGPRWRGDSKEIYFSTLDGGLTSVDLAPRGDSLQLGIPKHLFSGLGEVFDVAPAGDRILMPAPGKSEETTELRLIVNWPALLDRR